MLDSPVKRSCLTMQWVQDQVHIALEADGLLMTSWDCCREDELKACQREHVVRGRAAQA